MILQTFKAATMAEALTQVKSTMGAEAIILHTRTFSTRAWMGLRRKEMVEITAGKGMNIGRRRANGAAAGNGQQAAAGRGNSGNGGANNGNAKGGGGGNNGNGGAIAGTYSRTGTAPAAAGFRGNASGNADAPPRSAAEAGRQLLDTAGGTAAVFTAITQEMSALKAMVKDLVDTQRHQQKPQVPEDLFDYYLQLVQSQVADELATEIVRTLQKQVRPEHFTNPEYMRERLAEQLEKLVPTAGPIVRTKKTGPHVVALIGPTGVGKTTTIAKLAANLKLREKHRVGLITLDTYRIAAVDQLKRYADIIGSPLKVVASLDEVREAMRSMADCDFILIDTAGRSPNDTLKLNELKGLLEAAKPDEVHLVLSSTSSQECVELAVSRFGDVRVDRIIFTKIDEAAHVGVVLNVVRKVNKSLSYITTGQDVPDDIEVGKGKRLAQLILGTP